MTGGRLKQVRNYVRDEAFCFTYRDGVADVDITAQIAHHKTYGRLGTVTAVEPPGRYGALQFGENAAVSGFQEKPQWLSGLDQWGGLLDRARGDRSHRG